MQTLLVVDDERTIRDSLEHMLLLEGFKVLKAANGKEALACLANEPVSLILSDVMMPIMNGVDLVASLRANPDLNRLPVVLFSAGAAPTDPRTRNETFIKK